MRFLLPALWASMALVACGGGSDSQDTSATSTQITEYGLYARGTEIVRPDPSAPSGQARSSVGFKLLTQTTDVPLVLGISFGFCFETTTASGARPAVTVQVRFPAFTRPDGVLVNAYQVDPSLYSFGGKYWACLGYGYDHTYELVPGQWSFTVVVDGVAQATQTFTAR